MASTPFLPSQGLTLAYTLPLLCFSVPLTFAGAFLTLDRTRSFPPNDPKDGWFGQRSSETFGDWCKRNLRLQGGLGGLCAGFVFGQETFTLLGLLIPAEATTLSPLSSTALVIPALFCAVLCAIPSALLRPIALVFSGLAGGLTLALSVSIMTHPPLIARYTLLVLLEAAFLVFFIMPKTRHIALRVALASTGAFAVVQSISILCSFDGWSVPFERLYVSDGINWGTTQEHGMTALVAVLFAIGCGSDWLCKGRFGEDPDQRWDSLLANFSQSLPNRAGMFEPLPPWYSALLAPFQHMAPSQQPLLPGTYPINLDSKPPLTYMPVRAKTKLQKPAEKPRKAKDLSTGFTVRKRDPLVFAPSSLDSDSDDEDEEEKDDSRPVNPPRSRTEATLVGEGEENDVKSKTSEKPPIEADLADLTDPPPARQLRPVGEWKAFWSAVHHKASAP